MNTIWNIIAWIVSRQRIADWLIARSQRTPYFDIVKDGRTYMHRWWLFNPYNHETRKPRWRWLPFSIRVHHIVKPDDDLHLHDHPWNARTIILRGGYLEEIPAGIDGRHPERGHRISRKCVGRFRQQGDTNPIGFGEFHRIIHVAEGGAYTLFISGRYRGDWGFQVDGEKVPWREYLGIPAPFRLDLAEHIARQQRFSEATFGPGERAQGVIDHIRKELREIEAAPHDLEEWIDVATLAFDGAWRAGHSPDDIARALEAKLTKNESRSWPDWRTADRNKAIEHDRSGDVVATEGADG